MGFKINEKQARQSSAIQNARKMDDILIFVNLYLTRQGDNWSTSPENIHTCSVTVAERSI